MLNLIALCVAVIVILPVFSIPAEAVAITDCLIYGRQRVLIGGGSTVTGLVCSGNSVIGEAQLAGQSTVIGDVRAGGNVTLQNGASVTGTVTNPGTLTLGSGSTVGAHVVGAPDLPSLPAPTAFSAGGLNTSAVNNVGVTLAPGSYGNVNLGGSVTLTLSAGDYYFNALTAGNDLDLNINLAGGDIRIFVVGAIHFGSVEVLASGGTAADIYLETHYSGTGDAFFAGGATDWLGTVYAPYDSILLGGGSAAGSFQGYLWSGTEVDLGHNVNGTGETTPVPEPTSVVLLGLGLIGLVAQAWRKRGSMRRQPLRRQLSR